MKRYTSIKESALDIQKDILNPTIFDNVSIKQEVRNELINIFTSWIYTVAPEIEIMEMVLIGSSAGYRYNDSSDIDINVQVSEIPSDDFLKTLPNGNTLFDTNHPINYYIVTNNEAVMKADNAYDLLNDKWITLPKKDTTTINFSYVMEIANFFMAGIDDRIREYENDTRELNYYNQLLQSEEKYEKNEIEERISIKEEEIKSDLDSLMVAHNIIRSFRGEAFDEKFNTSYLIKISTKNPNFSINNLVYKILEQSGYLDKLNKYEELRKKYE